MFLVSIFIIFSNVSGSIWLRGKKYVALEMVRRGGTSVSCMLTSTTSRIYNKSRGVSC
jgi:hypothetical protein